MISDPPVHLHFPTRSVLSLQNFACNAFFFFFSSRRRHTRSDRDWSSDVCSSDLCVKGGSKYVLVSNGKVYQIANQTYADLAKHAGHTVRLAGETKGDSIIVSKIEIDRKSVV